MTNRVLNSHLKIDKDLLKDPQSAEISAAEDDFVDLEVYRGEYDLEENIEEEDTEALYETSRCGRSEKRPIRSDA